VNLICINFWSTKIQ